MPTPRVSARNCSLTKRVNTDFGEHEGPIAREIMEMRQVSSKVLLVMKINVECQKIGKFGFEIFGGKGSWRNLQGPQALTLFAQSTRLPKKRTYSLPLPYQRDYLRRNFIADEICKHRGMALWSKPTLLDNHITDFRLNFIRVQERYVLRPGNTDDRI